MTLRTGSTIAYVRVAAGGDGQAAPIVFIHGGPGVADMSGDLAFFRQLADDGREVILYDQVGAGRSGRLEDPTQYSLERDVADLEALLARLGVRSPVLVGHSYGGTVAAAFAASRPDRVGGLVFIAPGAIRPQRVVYGPQTVPWFTMEQRRDLYAALLHPRALLGWSLSQVDVRAAHALTGDAEFDAQFDRTYALTVPGLYCEAPPEPSLPRGLGFYTYAVARELPDLRPALGSVQVPALILKPQCDYLPWEFGTDLADALPGGLLVYVRGAGHSLYSEQPDAVLAEMRAFLAGSPLPIPAQTDGKRPKDLRGP